MPARRSSPQASRQTPCASSDFHEHSPHRASGMRRPKIRIADARKTSFRRHLLSELAPALGGLIHDVGYGLDNQRLSGIEMRIEPAMGQARLFHQVGHADPMGALLAKPHRGALHDPFVGFLLVLLGITHGPSDKMFTVI